MGGRWWSALGLAVALAGCGGSSPRWEVVETEPDSGGSAPEVSPAPAPDEETPSDDPRVTALREAFEVRLTVSTRRDGTRVLTRRCREGPVDCRARLTAFASLIVEVADAQGLDPLLLAAMALRESGLDPAALGRNREAGIVQLHPRGAGRGVRYVEDDGYRARCQSRVDACQREVLETGARTLSEGIARCGGLRGGLGAYASGHCTSRARYIDRVFEERQTLRELTR